MAARTQVTGPILHFVGFPGDESQQVFYFLGTSKVSPQIRIDRHYLPVMFEQGGYVLPMDLAYQGKEAKIVTQLNLFDQEVAYMLGCSPRYTKSRYALGRGLDSFRDIGSLTLGNKCYFSLYFMFPFAGTVNSPSSSTLDFIVNLTMAKIYRFPACVIEYDDQTGGSGEQELTLAIHAQRIFYPRSRYKSYFNGSSLAGGFFLYDNRLDFAPLIEDALRRSDLSSSLRTGGLPNVGGN